MTTKVIVSANRGWPVDVTPLPTTADGLVGPKARVPVGEEREFHVHSGRDDHYDEAVLLMLNERRASTSLAQRRLGIGYNAATRLMERMEMAGVVSAPNRFGKREVLPGAPTGEALT